jgi:hypothetical protein
VTGVEPDDPARGYVLLALRLDRLVPGLVDTYTGDLALRRQVDAEPAPRAADLVRQAGRLADALPAAGWDPDRERVLTAQLRAVECAARRLAGQHVPFVREVHECFETVVVRGDEDAYRQAHRDLDALVPGRGPLADRMAAHRRRDEVPVERLGAAVQALSEALRARVREEYDLPPGESVDYQVVEDAPWNGLCRQVGRHRSSVAVNAGARPRSAQLPHLVAHESYPGHHTENCRRELARHRGRGEHAVFVVNTPQALMAEGLADTGLHVVVGPGWGRWAQDVLAGVGVRCDGELVERIDDAMADLLPVRLDAALLLHDRRAPADEVTAHLRRWLLVDDSRAHRMLRFLTHPVWRAYTVTYVEGHRLVRGWLDQPHGDPIIMRHRGLLDEPRTPAALRAQLRAS